MKITKRIGARFRSWIRGIRNEFFLSVSDVQQAGVGPGKVGQGLDSNVVMAPIQFIQRTFTGVWLTLDGLQGILTLYTVL